MADAKLGTLQICKDRLNKSFDQPSECTYRMKVNIRFTNDCAAAIPIIPADGINHIAMRIRSMNGIDRTTVTAKQIRCDARIESVCTVHFLRMAKRNGSSDGNVNA